MIKSKTDKYKCKSCGKTISVDDLRSYWICSKCDEIKNKKYRKAAKRKRKFKRAFEIKTLKDPFLD